MTEVVSISLENEMDLVLAHKRSMKVAERLSMSIATQTTFATAVSEIARTVIDHTDNGNLAIGIEQNKLRYSLKAVFTFESEVAFTNEDKGYYYAQKLMPEFNMYNLGDITFIEMMIGLPRSLKLDPVKIRGLKEFFLTEEPINAYEEIKRRNLSLSKIAEERDEEIRRSKIVDEQKTEFISIASHEIKTPITIIKAYTQMAMMAGGPESETLRGILSKIDLQSAKLLALVQQLLDVSRIENGSLVYDKQHVSLNEFVLDMAEMMKSILPDHHVITELAEDAQVFIDKLRMEQVFSNLLGNAAKYSGKQTKIYIQTARLDENSVKVCITDQGIGMSESSIHSIFQKFYRDKDVITTHAGLGMGLYVTSKIITDHGGKIWVESNEGAGSSFFFTIPANIAQTA